MAQHAVTPTAGAILELIRRGEVTTRSEVAAATGLSRTAVTARLTALLSSGLIVEGAEARSTGGRPPVQLQFNAAAGFVLAAALGRSRTQMAVCDLDGTVLASSEFDHEDGLGPEELMPRVRRSLDKLMRTADVTVDRVRGVGLSLPGTIDPTTGMSFSSPVMRGWDGVPLQRWFEDLDCGVHVENDANALALAEAHGHALRWSDLVVLKASSGLGAGVFVNGALVRGARGAAGELGHTKVPGAEGRVCRCGDVGCLDTIAGGWALVKESADEGVPVTHVRDLVARALDGDANALRRIRESGRRVGEVLAGVVNLLNPGALVIGGDLAAAYDTFVAGLRETLYAGATAAASNALEIVPATHGADSGIVGCAQVAIGDALSPAVIDALLRREA